MSSKSKTKEESSTKGEIRETISTVVWALIIAFFLRTFIFQPFHIPSGSMMPGLVKGDYIITSKFSIGYGKHAAKPLPFPDVDGRLLARGPERGDVIVFRPEGLNENFVKRVIGLPGDQIQMIGGRLHINGEPTEITREGDDVYLNSQGRDVEVERWAETLDSGVSYPIYDGLKNGPADNTEIYTVPSGHYFMMGDNRDFSGDSRESVPRGAGYVPAEALIGKAEIVLLSVTDEFALFKPWTWYKMRGGRFFKAIE